MIYEYREITKENKVWVSVPHECIDGDPGKTHIIQGVIGGFVGSPRCAVSVESSFFYGVGRDGNPLSANDAWAIGLIEDHHLDALPGELVNELLIREVRFCGYPMYAAAIKACDATISKSLGKTERLVLSKLTARTGELVPFVARALLFCSLSKNLSTLELAAFVKLVRRGLIRAYKSFEGSKGYMLRFEIEGGLS